MYRIWIILNETPRIPRRNWSIIVNSTNEYKNLLDEHYFQIYKDKNVSQNMKNIENALDKLDAPLVNIFPQGKTDSKEIISTKPKIGLLNLGHPPGRKELEILSKWVEKKTLECKDEESKQVIYEFALYEIIRQVAVHCNERGVLLKKLFHELKIAHIKSISKLSNAKIEQQAETKIILEKKEEVIHNEKIANGHVIELNSYKKSLTSFKSNCRKIEKRRCHWNQKLTI